MTRLSHRQLQLTGRLAHAWSADDPRAMMRVLAPRVSLTIDHGGTPFGRELEHASGSVRVASSLRRLLRSRPTMTLSELWANGRPAIAMVEIDRIIGIVSVDIRRCRIVRVWIVTNPAKLNGWNTRHRT